MIGWSSCKWHRRLIKRILVLCCDLGYLLWTWVFNEWPTDCTAKGLEPLYIIVYFFSIVFTSSRRYSSFDGRFRTLTRRQRIAISVVSQKCHKFIHKLSDSFVNFCDINAKSWPNCKSFPKDLQLPYRLRTILEIAVFLLLSKSSRARRWGWGRSC